MGLCFLINILSSEQKIIFMVLTYCCFIAISFNLYNRVIKDLIFYFIFFIYKLYLVADFRWPYSILCGWNIK